MYLSNGYNTPRRAVSDLQSPIPRACSTRGGGDCKSDTAQLGVLKVICVIVMTQIKVIKQFP